MRILFLIHQFMPDFAAGTERVTLNLAKAAQAQGHRVEILTVTQKGGEGWRRSSDGLLEAMIEGVPVTAIHGVERPLIDLGFIPDEQLARTMTSFLKRRPGFDIAHVTHAMRLTDALEVLATVRLPYIITLTDYFTLCHRVTLIQVDGAVCAGPDGGAACRTSCAGHGLGEAAPAQRLARYRRILEQASAVVAVSDHAAHRVRTEYPGIHVRVIQNGVDLLSFRPRTSARSNGPITIGYLGTISQAKGVLMLARAFAAAGPIEARLRLVGPIAEPEVAAELARLAETSAINVEGPVEPDRVPDLLREFDLLATPSQWPETFCLSLHEGFAAGLPALVSDLGNPGETIRASGAGRAIDAADVEAWTREIAEVARRPDQIDAWAKAVPLPMRVEEEAFLYSQLYQAAIG